MSLVSRRKILGASLGGLLGAGACASGQEDAQGPQGDRKPQPTGTNESPPSALDRGLSPELPAPLETAPLQTMNQADPGREPAQGSSEQGADSFVCERVETVVGRNHGHVLLVSETEILSGFPKTYSLRGTASHDHVLQLSKEEFASIGRGETLRKKTEFGADHRHRILVRCRPLVLPPELVTACQAIIAGEDGHEVVIPESDLRAGIERRYDIQGVSGHTHGLVISPEEFRRLVTGERLDLRTEYSAGHYHHAYIQYAPAPSE